MKRKKKAPAAKERPQPKQAPRFSSFILPTPHISLGNGNYIKGRCSTDGI